MKRVAVIGAGGAGESSPLSRPDWESTPVVHLDELYWRPGWVATPPAEWLGIVGSLVEADRWIIDGNYGGLLSSRLQRADTVVFLDLPRVTCLRRAVWRSARHHGHAVQATGCPERFNLEFFSWIWNYPIRSRPRVLDAIKHRAPDAGLYRVASWRAARGLLTELVEIDQRFLS